ncbi:mucin-binding protein [Schleiferilactobacillus perolens]|uniref:mucin-binding protein n=1 Tax=Schleiferilactobacillus perolens TaxID=100468 RepID=UPI00070E3EB1|nr:KxYKxGKxW signal peptide domain-containing protein [Schleiferilactobacillus perolens]
MSKDRRGLKRLYKAGKFWVAAGAGLLLLTGTSNSQQKVDADTAATPVANTQNTTAGNPIQAAAKTTSPAAPTVTQKTAVTPSQTPTANDQPAPTSSATVTGPTVTDDSNLNDPLVYSLSGSFKKGDKIQLLIPAGTLKFLKMGSISSGTIPTGTTSTTVNGVAYDALTINMTSDSTVSTSVYYSVNASPYSTGASSKFLSDGKPSTDIPVLLQVNGKTASQMTTTFNKKPNQPAIPSNGWAIFDNQNIGAIVDPSTGTYKQQAVTKINWQTFADRFSYTKDYLKNWQGYDVFTAPTTVTITLPAGVKVISAEKTIADAPYTVSQSGNQYTFTFAAGTPLRDGAGSIFKSGFFKIVSEYDGDVGTGKSLTLTAAVSTAINGQTYQYAVNSKNAFSYQPFVGKLSMDSSASFARDSAGNGNSYLPSFTKDPLADTSSVFWGSVLDKSNYDYQGHPEAQLTINPTLKNSMNLTSVTNVSDPSYWKSIGFTDNVELIFTTASGKTDVQKVVSGKTNYVTTIGSQADPVLNVVVRSVDEVRPTGSVGTVTGMDVAHRLSFHAEFYSNQPQAVHYRFQTTQKNGDQVLSTPAGDWQTINYDSVPRILIQEKYYTGVGFMGWDNLSAGVTNAGDTISFRNNLQSLAISAGNPGQTSALVGGQNAAAYNTYLAANPDAFGVYVRIPKYTTFAGVAALRNAWDNQNLQAQTFVDKNGDTVLYINHLTFTGSGTTARGIPVIVNSGLAPNTLISFSAWDFGFRPDASIFRFNGTQLTRGASFQDDWNNGNVYYNSKDNPTFSIKTVATSDFVQSAGIQGSADNAFSHTGKINTAKPTAVVTHNLYNGTTNTVTIDSSLTLGDKNSQHMHLTGPIKIVDDATKNDITSTAKITYLDAAGVTTTYDKAASIQIERIAVGAKSAVTVTSNIKLDDDQLKDSIVGKSYSFPASATVYGADGTPIKTDEEIPLTATLVRQVNEQWQVVTKDPDGKFVSYNDGKSDQTTTGMVGDQYTAAPFKTGQTIGTDHYVTQIVDAAGNPIDPTTLQYTDTSKDAQGNPVGATYYVVVAPTSETTTKDVTYTVNFVGAGDATPQSVTKTVTWTHTIDNVHGTQTWTPNTTDVSMTAPTVAGYTPNQAVAFKDALTASTTEPTNQSQTITYAPSSFTSDVTIHSNKGDQVVKDVTGNTGDIVAVNVPDVTGYEPDKTTVDAMVNADGTITVLDGDKGGAGYVTYSPKEITGTVTLPTNQGNKTVPVTGKADSDVQVDTPPVQGYTPDQDHFTAHINADGTITTKDKITYTPNEVTNDVLIHTNLGDKVVPDIKGTVDTQVDVPVPSVEGYTADKQTVKAQVNPDGTIKVIDGEKDGQGYVTYTPKNITGSVTISTNHGPKTVTGVKGTVGDNVTVDTPAVPGYTPDKKEFTAHINADGTITTTDTIVYTANDVTANVTIPSNKGGQVVNGVTGKVGTIVDVTVPKLDGYTEDKQTVKAQVNADGTITVIDGGEGGQGYVTYTANQVTLPVTVPSNLGPKTIEVVGHSGETVQGKVPEVAGYDADKEYVTVHISDDGKTATTNDTITYTAKEVSTDVTIHSNMGDQIVKGVTGKTDETVKVPVPPKTGYTADKTTVDAKVNPDGTITVIDGEKAGGAGYVTYVPNDVTGSVTVPTNLGNKTVPGISGKVGDDVSVASPYIQGYTPDKDHFTAHINPDGTITTKDTLNYTANAVTNEVVIHSNLGDQIVKGITGKTGDIVKVPVPGITGYTPNKTTVDAIVNADGTITVIDGQQGGKGFVTYSPNTISGSVTIHTNLGDKTVSGITGSVNSDVQVPTPPVQGYTPDKDHFTAHINADGSITTTDTIKYTPNMVTGDVTIKTNLGDKTVHNVSGLVGSDIQVPTPVVLGYTADKPYFTAHVNADGTITTTDTIVYTKVKDPDQPGGNPDQPGGNPDESGGNPDQPGKPGKPETNPGSSDNNPDGSNTPSGKHPGTSGTTNGTTGAGTATNSANTKGKLPQTSESHANSRVLSAIGVSLMGLLAAFGLVQLKRKRDTEK